MLFERLAQRHQKRFHAWNTAIAPILEPYNNLLQRSDQPVANPRDVITRRNALVRAKSNALKGIATSEVGHKPTVLGTIIGRGNQRRAKRVDDIVNGLFSTDATYLTKKIWQKLGKTVQK